MEKIISISYSMKNKINNFELIIPSYSFRCVSDYNYKLSVVYSYIYTRSKRRRRRRKKEDIIKLFIYKKLYFAHKCHQYASLYIY